MRISGAEAQQRYRERHRAGLTFPRGYKMAIVDRFWPRVRKSAGCWEWMGARSSGYGVIRSTPTSDRHSRLVRAHRLSWLIHRGPIPAGLQIDHLCRNRACVNPEHMEPVTQRENTRRGDSPAGIYFRRTQAIRETA